MTLLTTDVPQAVPAERLRPSRANRWGDVTMLVAGTLVLIFALSMVTVGQEQVAFFFAPDVALPHLCMSRVFFNVECPGCGLTRSFIALAHGDLAASIRFHHVGWLVALLVFGQIPYRAYALATGKRLPERATMWIVCGVIAIMLINWVWELLA